MRIIAEAEERFWAKVDASGDCWEWTASTVASGYGNFWAGPGVWIRPHRFSWETLVGEIAPGLDLDHLCRNRGCVNPDHLEPVSRKTNLLRGFGTTARNASKVYCPQGHPYSEENTTYRKRKGNWARRCRTCHRDQERKRYRENHC